MGWRLDNKTGLVLSWSQAWSLRLTPVKYLQTQTNAKVNKPVTKTKNLNKMNEQSTIFLYPSTDVLNVRACKKSYRNKKRHSTQDTEVRCSVENINLVNNLSV